ncbi:MAG: FCD domain-containing protein [Ilumatobacteraceae bacterium]
MNQPVKVPKAASLVATSLRRRIVLGDLSEGEALPNETELMAYYEVSRPTLREALRILETESLISVKRGAHGGARVAIPDASVTARHAALILRMQGTTLEDVFVSRLIIEPAAVRLLAARALADPTVLQPLRDLHEELGRTTDRGAYAHLAARFHEQVIELAGNRTLTLVGLILMEIVEPHNKATFSHISEGARYTFEGVARQAQRDHADLIDVIASGDGDAAAAMWETHMKGAMTTALKVLGAGTRIGLLEESG